MQLVSNSEPWILCVSDSDTVFVGVHNEVEMSFIWEPCDSLTRYGLDDPGIASWYERDLVYCRDRNRGPPSLLYNECRVSAPGIKWPEHGIALYLYSPSRPSWPVLEWISVLLPCDIQKIWYFSRSEVQTTLPMKTRVFLEVTLWRMVNIRSDRYFGGA